MDQVVPSGWCFHQNILQPTAPGLSPALLCVLTCWMSPATPPIKGHQGWNRTLAFLPSKYWDSLITPACCTEVGAYHDKLMTFWYWKSPIWTNRGVRLYNNFRTELSIHQSSQMSKTVVEWFWSFEQGFLAASFSPALLSAWGLEQTHLHPCHHTCATHLSREQSTCGYMAAQTNSLQKMVFGKFHSPFSYPSYSSSSCLSPFTLLGKNSLLLGPNIFVWDQDAAGNELLCINSLADQLLIPSHALEISVVFSTFALKP